MAVEIAATHDEMPQIHPHRLLRWMVFLTAVTFIGRLHLANIHGWHSPVLDRGLSFVPWLAALVADIRFEMPYETFASLIGYVYFGVLLYVPVFKPADRLLKSAGFLLVAISLHAAITGLSLLAFGAVLQT